MDLLNNGTVTSNKPSERKTNCDLVEKNSRFFSVLPNFILLVLLCKPIDDIIFSMNLRDSIR